MVVFLHYSPTILILLVYVTICFTQELSGPNICRYEVTEIQSRRKAVPTTRYSPNCPGEQAQCRITRYIISYDPYYTEEESCCEGWIQTGNNCSLPCTNNTFGRNCSQTCNCTPVNSYCDPIGGCSCLAGWKEPNCSSPCDPGSYSYSCSCKCICLNDASCDPISGSCNCTPGWTGSACNVTCPAGRYGNDCQENCTCLEGAVCDPVNGSCSCLPDRIGPNCTLLEESTTHQTPVMQESNPLGSDSTGDLQKLVMVAISGITFAVGITIGFIICILYKRYSNSNRSKRASSTGITDDQETDGRDKNRGATQSGLQTPESGALLISTEISQQPECATSTENADVMHMYATTITQSDERTRNPHEEAPSRVSLKHNEELRATCSTAVANTSLAEGECAYCDVKEVNTPLQVIAAHSTHSGEIEHTYYQRNTHV